MKAVLLWIDGRPAESASLIAAIRKKGYRIETVPTGSEAVARLPELDPDLVVVNAAFMRSSGTRICNTLRKTYSKLPIVVIVSNSSAIPKDNSANAVLPMPFTPRKLLNRIVPLLPGDGRHLLHVGPIRLDWEHKRVNCQGREARLTPRLTRLLKIFMEHPREVFERGALFREVWETGYTGDTRTLDVHISWLRQAIEKDPRNPVYLKTIRGVGYRLDV
jgi:DNA-binding response OmpR family regulator